MIYWGEKKIPKQQILVLLVSNLFVGNKLRPQSSSWWTMIKNHLRLVLVNLEQHRYTQPCTFLHHYEKQAYPQWAQLCLSLSRETFVSLGPSAGVTESLPDNGSPCFDTMASMHPLLSPAKPAEKKPVWWSKKRLDMAICFGFKLPRGLFIRKKKKRGFWKGKITLIVVFI